MSEGYPLQDAWDTLKALRAMPLVLTALSTTSTVWTPLTVSAATITRYVYERAFDVTRDTTDDTRKDDADGCLPDPRTD